MLAIEQQRRVTPMSSTSYPSMSAMAVNDMYQQYACPAPENNQSHPFYTESSYQRQASHCHDATPPVKTEIPFNPWLLEAPPSTNTISRTPSLSGSESVCTPPSFTETQSMYPMISQPLPFGASTVAQVPTWVNNSENDWQLQQDSSTWATQPVPLGWNGEGYHELSLPSQNHCIPQYTENTASSFQNSMQPYQFSPSQATDSVTLACSDEEKRSIFSSDGGSDSEGTEYDENFSEIYHNGLHKGVNESTQVEHKQTPSVLKLGKWSMSIDSYTHPEQRHYACPFSMGPDPHGRGCNKRFVRPEHLRRHVKTVHGDARDYICKVPRCHRAFSRGDNLRDHYWTHISRGGRAGKNDKMSFAELRDILGPKEKKLIKRLKTRLLKQKNRTKAKL